MQNAQSSLIDLEVWKLNKQLSSQEFQVSRKIFFSMNRSLSDSVLGIVCRVFSLNGKGFSMRLLYGSILEQNLITEVSNNQQQ